MLNKLSQQTQRDTTRINSVHKPALHDGIHVRSAVTIVLHNVADASAMMGVRLVANFAS